MGKEINHIIKQLNNTKKDFPRDKCIHTFFEEQAAKTPDNIALEFGDKKITFAELNSKANRLANYLRKNGVTNEVLVAVCMERSIDTVVCLFAVIKSGGAYVPVDPNYPQERISYLINDSQPEVILTQEKFSDKVNTADAKIINVDRDWGEIEIENSENTGDIVSSENLAYVIYTSGSTGKPKGVMGTHRAAINRFYWMWKSYPFGKGEICCQKTSLSFVDSIWEIFGPLLMGTKLVIISDEELKDNFLFLKMLSEKNISRIVLVPSLLRVILDTYNDAKQNLTNLHYWFCSGEALTFDLYKNFKEALPENNLINLYGSSEVAADVTVFDTRDVKGLDYIPIGKPIFNCEIYVLDSELNSVKAGEQGELYVTGECLARGYLHKADLTKEKFIPNKYNTGNYPLLYKTGDIVRYDEAGNIEYLGRTDHQVKIRGFRIELGEIENAVKEFHKVKEVVVLAKEDAIRSKYLSVYITFYENKNIDENILRNFLKEKIPEYMIPADFIFLDSMPLTPNGKIDRNALIVMQATKFNDEKIFANPKTPTEEAVLEIWQEVLGQNKISVYDNFFNIGGHSLLATKIISRIRKSFDIELPLKTVFEKPTINEMADYIQTIIIKEVIEMSEDEALRLIN